MRSVLEKLLQRIQGYAPIGSAGYTMPDLGLATAISFRDLPKETIKNLKIIGQSAHDNNYVVFIDKSEPKREIRLHVGPHTKGAIVVLGDDLTVCGDYELHSSEQTVIISGGTPRVGHSGRFHAKLWATKALFFVGRGSTTNGAYAIVSGASRSIIIGDDCMLADGIHISTHDQHAVIDLKENLQINSARSVLIEPHVWVGRMSSISKGATVGLGSIIGAHSLVTSRVERMTSVGGVPARLIRRDVTWDRFENMEETTINRVRRLAEQVAEPSA